MRRVEVFDSNKRKEQRAMQNKEVQEFYMKKVDYKFFDEQGEQFEPIVGTYQILWYDPKMKNFELLQEHLNKKRLIHAQI